jgi:Secretion system C-terminal sorting domain
MMDKRFVLLLAFLFSWSLAFTQVLPDTIFNKAFRSEIGGWIASDATFSIELTEDSTLWLFGDTFIGTVNPDSSIADGAAMIRNCAVLQAGDSFQSLFTGTFENPDSFVPSIKSDSAWLWPEHGLIENDTLKIFFSEFVFDEGPAGFSFLYNKLILANFSWPEIELINEITIPYYDTNGVMYGDRVIEDDGYNYIFGRKESDTVYHIPYPHVARVPVGNILAPWQFFDGISWSDDPTATAFVKNHPVSQQYCVFKHLDKFILLTQEIWFGKKIYSFVADQIEGPYSNKSVLYETPILYAGTFTYNAYAHPQFIQNNQLLVSYNSNGDFWEIFNNVETYRPNFINVPMHLIDNSFVSGIDQIDFEANGMHTQLFPNYPNPAKESTTLDFKTTAKKEIILRIFDIDGREVFTSSLGLMETGQHKFELDLNKLSPGFYFYNIDGQSGKIVKL